MSTVPPRYRRGPRRPPSPPPPALAELRAVAERLAGLERGLAALRGERDRLVREAITAGCTHRAVASAAGVTHSRIPQILDSAR